MRLSTLFTINAILATLYGLALVLAPATFFDLYGVTADDPLQVTGQFFGGALLAFGVLTWQARGEPDSNARRAIVLSLFVGDAVGFFAGLFGQLRGVVNALGWTTVALYLLLGVAWGYFYFVKPAAD